MRRPAWLVLVLVLLSGCLSDDAQGEGDDGGAEVSPGDEPVDAGRGRDGRDPGAAALQEEKGRFDLQREFGLEVTGTRPATGTFSINGISNAAHNCVYVEGVDAVVNATLIATWAPEIDGLDELELRVEGNRTETVTGVSPLQLDLDGGFGLLGALMVMPTMPGAQVQQDVSVSLEMTYDGSSLPAFADGWSCSRF